jgi:simple sugar transport system substrate-binding protein
MIKIAPKRRNMQRRELMTYMKTMTALALTASTIACSAALLASPASAEEKQLTFAIITHAQPGDTFWDIIRKGANAAAEKDHVKLLYLSAPEGPKEAELIQNVIDQHVDGIALTLASRTPMRRR